MNLDEELAELTEPRIREPQDLNYLERGMLLAHFYNWLRETDNPMNVISATREIIRIISEREHDESLLMIMNVDRLFNLLVEYNINLLASLGEQQVETLEEIIYLAQMRVLDLKLD